MKKLEELKIKLFDLGLNKIKEGNLEEAKVYFDAARTANELSASTTLFDQVNDNVEAIKNDIAKEPVQEPKATKGKEVSIAMPNDIVEEQPVTEHEEVAMTEFALEQQSDDKVYFEDKLGNEIDITYEFKLIDGLTDNDKKRKQYAYKLQSSNSSDIFNKLENVSLSEDKVKLAFFIGKYTIAKINKLVSNITSGVSHDVYEYANDNTTSHLVEEIVKNAKKSKK